MNDTNFKTYFSYPFILNEDKVYSSDDVLIFIFGEEVPMCARKSIINALNTNTKTNFKKSNFVYDRIGGVIFNKGINCIQFKCWSYLVNTLEMQGHLAIRVLHNLAEHIIYTIKYVKPINPVPQ